MSSQEVQQQLYIQSLEQRIKKLESQGVPGVKDFFATSALSCLANNAVAAAWKPQDIAEFCYDVAEAMLKERTKREAKLNDC